MRLPFALSGIAAIGLSIVVRTAPFADRMDFNGEEHKLVGDRGMAAVDIPPSVMLPPDVSFTPIDASDYVLAMQRAKRLAVGFETNDLHDFDASADAIQDNCYSTWPVNAFKQSEFNKKLWVPPLSETPQKVLLVPGYTSPGVAHLFTFGELVGFYGDLRQIPYCEGGTCYVTNGDVAEVRFVPAPLVANRKCPPPLSPGEYIADMGAGLVPPIGSLGNAVLNTAKRSGDYWDAGWWGDEMLRIAKANDSHFSSVAVAWYVGMHRLALLYADSARVDSRYWVKALHYEANALHNLTDLFLFGHVVVNCDEASHAIIKDSGLKDGPVYQWMENVIAMGGARRGDDGIVALSSDLPALADRPGIRNASQPIAASIGNNTKRLAEMFYHNAFNSSGGTVRNLRGDEFTILGDGDLDTELGLYPDAVAVTSGAVTASVQSLFNAFVRLSEGAVTVEQMSRDTALFAALRFLPVFVVHDPGKYFTGRWTRFAQAINEISGAGLQLNGWPDCQVPFVSGAYFKPNVPQMMDMAVTGDMLRWPEQQNGPCATYQGARHAAAPSP